MADARTCPDCGSELPPRAPEGLCPRCLLGVGLNSDALSVGRAGEVGATMSLGSGGVLETITATLGAVPRVLLRDTDAGLEPPLVRLDREAGDGSTRYRIDGEIARGGMGAVLKGRDPDLGRDVAIKVLREDLLPNPDMVRRFVEEAQIGGQLQHPGIVPIYELGAFADRRPFFSMKLVKGHTLAALLDARRDPATDLPRLLNIVEAVAQTVAYAHARGVIHRDLKPSNVMVGSFGEVQVMDWGLAKVLPRGGVVDDASAGKPDRDETVIATARSGSDSDQSRAGSVLGTPSYMAPEQARGEIERVDERADVFALGSILCEVLTGQPAFTGRSSGEIQRKAALGDTSDALARLDGCGADPELVALARDCLAREPEDRPREAGAVAERISAHLAGVQDRLRAAELAEVEARAHAEEERKRRKLTVALAASLIGTAVLVGGGWAWTAEQKAERAAVTGREVNQALAEAAELRGRARATGGGDLALLELSLAEAKRSTSLLARGEGDPELRDRARSFLADVTRERDEAKTRAAEAERDRRMAHRLAEIKVEFSSHNDRSKMDADYAAAFHEYGLDLDALPAAEAGAGIVARRIADDLVSAIDQWTFCRRHITPPDLAAIGRLIAVANAADSDPWRRRLRDALGRDDREALRQLAATADIDHLSPESTSRLAQALTDRGDAETSVVVMRAVLRRHRDDFWLNYDLAEGLISMKPPQLDEALQYATVEAALRPRSCWALNHLGLVLAMHGRPDDAVAAYREAIRLDPRWFMPRGNLGKVLETQGKPDEAIAAYREATLARPDLPETFDGLAFALLNRGKIEEAIVAWRGGPPQPRLRLGPQGPRRLLAEAGEVRRGRRRIPRGDPVPTRLRRGPQESRRHAAGPGAARRGHRRLRPGDPPQPRERRGPRRTRRRTLRQGGQGRLDRRVRRGDPTEADLLRPALLACHGTTEGDDRPVPHGAPGRPLQCGRPGGPRARPEANGPAGGGGRGGPRLDPPQAGIQPGPPGPRLGPPGAGGLGRRDLRLPRGDPPQALLRQDRDRGAPRARRGPEAEGAVR